jgi:hypothetical protein
MSVTIPAGTAPKIEWVMRDPNGNPVDLTTCGFPVGDACNATESSSLSSQSSESSAPAEENCGAVKFRMIESLTAGCRCPCELTAPDVYIKDAGTGRVVICIPKEFTQIPGVYLGEVTICDPDGCPIFSNIFYLNIQRGLNGSCVYQGPPSYAEIRLHLRDNHAVDNTLLDRVAYSDAEINAAIERPVMFWNEEPPPIQVYNTATFPFRWAWMEGICANLFMMAEEWYRRNDFQYSAAGVSVADMNKFQLYAEAGSRRWQAYQTWVKRKKISMNLEGGYSEIGSTYSNLSTAGNLVVGGDRF